jgi:hypothetical protein
MPPSGAFNKLSQGQTRLWTIEEIEAWGADDLELAVLLENNDRHLPRS